MAKNSQNPNRSDNIVSLNRHEFVAELEKKLVEARRLFSLQDYRASEELVMEVLAADPQNSKAKALHDLAALKLSKRKLYQKMVAPEDKASAELTSTPARPGSNTLSSPVEQPSPEDPIHAAPVESSTAIVDPPTRRRRIPASEHSEASVPVDTMRERTIAAMVELLKEKGKPAAGWKEIREAALHSESSAQTLPSQETEPLPAAKADENQKVSHQPQIEARAPNDFFSGSLEELFASEKVPSPDVMARLQTFSPTEPIASPRVQRPSPPLKSQTREPERPNQVPASPSVLDSQRTSIEFPGFLPPSRQAHTPSPASVNPESPIPRLPEQASHLDKALGFPQAPVVQLPDVRLFDQITQPVRVDLQGALEENVAQQLDEPRHSETKDVSIAQIKKYLYQGEYDLCGRELARIRDRFPQSCEIHSFFENTSKRLTELQRVKAFEQQAKELMASAVSFYQEGKFEEALIAAREILQVNPHHTQAKEFVSFVERRQSKERKREISIEKLRYCKACGTNVDAVSQFCFRCGKRLV